MPSLEKCIGGMETPRWLGASGQLRVNARRPAVSELIARFGPAKASFSLGGDKMAFQWDQSVLGQSLAFTEHPGCRLDTIIAIARPMHPRAASSEFQAWSVEGWRFSGADCV